MATDSTRYDSAFINTATTTVVRSTPGVLACVDIGTTAAGAITIYDNASAASGTILAEFKASIAEGNHPLYVRAANGITILTAAASHLTVTHTS